MDTAQERTMQNFPSGQALHSAFLFAAHKSKLGFNITTLDWSITSNLSAIKHAAFVQCLYDMHTAASHVLLTIYFSKIENHSKALQLRCLAIANAPRTPTKHLVAGVIDNEKHVQVILE